jgi:hypothetical protein
MRSYRTSLAPRRGGVLLWVVVIVVGVVIFGVYMTSRHQQESLAEADQLYKAGQKAAAAEKYKAGYPAAGGRKAEVIKRIVEHEATKGSSDEAKKWMEKGLDEKLTLDFDEPAAKSLLTQVNRDREARVAKQKAEEEARRKSQEAVAGERNAAKKNRDLPRDQFRNLVLGKSQSEVLSLLGKPNDTQDDQDLGHLWYYNDCARDPVTGKRSLVQIVFEGGQVTTVNFN